MTGAAAGSSLLEPAVSPGGAGAAPVPAPGVPGAGRRGGWVRLGPSPREGLTGAMVELAFGCGWENVSVDALCRRAGVTRRSFNALFSSREDCFDESVEAALERLWASVTVAVEHAEPVWTARISAAIVGFLRFLKDQPEWAWMSIVEPLGGGDRARLARRSVVERFSALLADGPPPDPSRDRPSRSTAPGTVGGLWEMARLYLREGAAAVDLDDVARSTVFLSLSPFVDRRTAMRHALALPKIDAVLPLAGPVQGTPDESETDGAADAGLTQLGVMTLTFLEMSPDAPSFEVGAAIGIEHASQTSRHLHRLQGLGLVTSRPVGRRRLWALTDEGQRVITRLSRP